MTLNMKWWLLTVCLIVCALPATAQFFNLSRVGRPSETTFANAGQPWPYSTATINAENYDVGGQGIGYNVPVPSGSCLQSSSYRPDTVNFNASSTGPAFVIGCSAPGLSYNYTINLSGTGPYNISANLSDTSAGGSWGVYLDNISIGTIATPNTGSFTTFQPAMLSTTYNAVPGNHVLQFRALGGDAAFNGSGDFASFTLIPPPTGAIACDIGPNFVGSIPTPAQEAGFTHCVANLDWSNAQFANTATWLAQCGAASPIAWFFSNNGIPSPCSDAQMVDDTANGGKSQTLRLAYTMPTDWNNNVESTWAALSDNHGDPHPPGLTLFPSYYTQYVMRTDSTTFNSSLTDHNAIMVDVWSYPVGNSCNGVAGAPLCDVIMEQDFVEFQQQPPSPAFADAGAVAGNAHAFNGMFGSGSQMAVSYNTFGFLSTVASPANSPNIANCWFVNGANMAPCSTRTISSVDLNDYDDFFFGQVGPQKSPSDGNVCGFDGDMTGHTCKPSTTQMMFETSLQIWACPGYKTGPCFGVLVTNP